MNFKKIAHGRRGEIWLDEFTMIARKKAISEEKRGPLLKESRILSYMKKHTIGFVPQIIEELNDWFTYHWIEGEHFIDAYTTATKTEKKQLLHNLLSCAVELDKIGVVHGELLRPFTNVLVWNDLKVSLIDFERGSLQDFSGKNTKHVMQRLSNQWFLDVPTLRDLASLSLEDLSISLKKLIDQGPLVELDEGVSFWIPDLESMKTEWLRESRDWGIGLLLRLLVGIAFVVWIDQVTKILFVDQEQLSSLDRVTPTINTGIARSIPIPFWLIIAISALFLLWLFWYMKYEITQVKNTWKVTSALMIFKIWMVLLIGWWIGNLIDRVALDGVRDFIDLNEFLPFPWAIFNVADIAISVGMVLVLWWEFKGKS